MPEIIATNNDIRYDVELKNYITLPISCLDPRYPGLSSQAKYEILTARYHNQLIADGIETGLIVLNPNGQYNYNFTNRNIESVIGFIFESYIVDKINKNMRSIGRRLFELCTRRQQTTDAYIDQFFAIGTGFTSTDKLFPYHSNRTSNVDIIFIRKNKEGKYEPATEMGSSKQAGITAGIQIKTITCGEKEAIVDKVLSGRYSCVLTLLSHNNGRDCAHSVEHCRIILKSMKSLDPSQRNDALMKIVGPADVGLDQRDIDDYYQYILHWAQGLEMPDQNINNGAGMEIKTTKYCEGVLVPQYFGI